MIFHFLNLLTRYTISAIIPAVPTAGLINGLSSHATIRMKINAMMINDRNVAIIIPPNLML